MANNEDLKKRLERDRQINEANKTREEKFREDIRKNDAEKLTHREQNKTKPDFGRPTMERPSKDEE